MDFDLPTIAQDHIAVQPGGGRGAGRFERRPGAGPRPVCRAPHGQTADDDGPARMEDVPAEGLGAGPHGPVMLGDVVIVRSTEDIAVTGRIAWSCGAECGVRLSGGVGQDGGLHPGQRVTVSLSSGPERRGVVRWSHGAIAELTLLAPFRPVHGRYP